MKAKAAPKPSSRGEVNEKKELSAKDCRILRGTYPGYDLLPETLRHIVIGYLSDDTKDSTKYALLGKQPITLCLSQHADLKLSSCWRFGCLSPGDEWEVTSGVRVDKHCLIKDYKSCLDYLGRENSSYCPITIKALVVQLDVSSPDFSSIWDELERSIVLLGEHLRKVQHVVFVIEKHTFCCFNLKDTISDAPGQHRTVNRPLALKRIFDDLSNFWATNQTPNTKLLLDHYIFNQVKPESDIYLSKIALSLKSIQNGRLCRAVAPTMNNSKLVWIQDFETMDDAKRFSVRSVRHLHAFYFDASLFDGFEGPRKRLSSNHDFENSPFIERIVINCSKHNNVLGLPKPRAALTDTTPRSALIELTLKCDKSALDLVELNNGYFPNLIHLSILDGYISGHLDSHSVPCLRTLVLKLESRNHPNNDKLEIDIQEQCQSIIHAGRPWQLVATESREGWSLASYDKPTPNPQEDAKEDSPHSSPRQLSPLIRELLLVASDPWTFYDWYFQLEGNPGAGPDAENRGEGRLLWAPDRVEKITAFAMTTNVAQLYFNRPIPGHERILSSLSLHSINTVIDFDTLPNLRSLSLYQGQLVLSGALLQLQTLSFKESRIDAALRLEAPLLKSFDCDKLISGNKLKIHLPSLPCLSYLRISPWNGLAENSPVIDVMDDRLGLSRVNHVVLEKGMAMSPIFSQCKLYDVLHLELTIESKALPKWWSTTVWQCENLTLNVDLFDPKRGNAQEMCTVFVPQKLPRLKLLTVTEKHCHVLVDTELPLLEECTLPSPRSLGRYLKCPALRCIYFTEKLSESDKEKCLNPATYKTMRARPSWVYFTFENEARRMSWNAAPSAPRLLSLAGLSRGGRGGRGSSVLRKKRGSMPSRFIRSPSISTSLRNGRS